MKALFRTALFVLAHFEDKLVKMTCEDLVQFLNELPKTDFFNSPEIEKEYRRRIKEFNISRGLLDELNAEYDRICRMSKEYKNSASKPAGSSYRYFIRTAGEENKLVAVYFPK